MNPIDSYFSINVNHEENITEIDEDKGEEFSGTCHIRHNIFCYFSVVHFI